MRIKIIGENNCARATRHLLQLAGFAVTEFLSFDRDAVKARDAAAGGPLAGYAITIDLAPAPHTPDSLDRAPRNAAGDGEQALQRPDPPTHHPHAPAKEEAPSPRPASGCARDASSPAFASLRDATAGGPASTSHHDATAGEPTSMSLRDASADVPFPVIPSEARNPSGFAPETQRDSSAKNLPRNDQSQGSAAHGAIHFDSVESALEAAVLRHVTQLSAAPVILDRPGGVVHSDRELRIVAPNTGDAREDEAAAAAIEFGVLRGLLDLTAAPAAALPKANSRSEPAKKWWPFGMVVLAMLCGAGVSPANWLPARAARAVVPAPPSLAASLSPAPRMRAGLAPWALRLAGAEAAQGQFATGEGFKITDGTNFLAVDPCAAQPKLYASINQTANAQIVAGTASKKIYVCSIHVVAAAAANVAVVEGTGTVCAAGTAGVSGFGGATAATGWNFAANGGIALGNGDSSLGAEATGGDNLCVFNSGSSQISGGISYVAQ